MYVILLQKLFNISASVSCQQYCSVFCWWSHWVSDRKCIANLAVKLTKGRRRNFNAAQIKIICNINGVTSGILPEKQYVVVVIIIINYTVHDSILFEMALLADYLHRETRNYRSEIYPGSISGWWNYFDRTL